MGNFLDSNRDQRYLIHKSLEDTLPNDHLAKRIVKFVEDYPLHHFKIRKDSAGKKQFNPHMVMSLLIYCFIQGINTSRRIEWFAIEGVAGRYIMNEHSIDHSTICRFINANCEAIAVLMIHVLEYASKMGYLTPEHAIVDGTKVIANANMSNSIKYEDFDVRIKEIDKERNELIKDATAMLQEIENGSKAGGIFFDSETGSRTSKEFMRICKRLFSLNSQKEGLIEAKKDLEDEAILKTLDAYRNGLESQVLDANNDKIERYWELSHQVQVDEMHLEEFESSMQDASDLERACMMEKQYRWRNKLNRKKKKAEESWEELQEALKKGWDWMESQALSEEEIERRMKMVLAAEPSPDKKMNSTDPGSRIMRHANKSYASSYNVQMAIDNNSMIILSCLVTQDGNDLQQLRPVVEFIRNNVGPVDKVDADCGYHNQHQLKMIEVTGTHCLSQANTRGDKKKLKKTPTANEMRRREDVTANKQRMAGRGKIEAINGHKKRNKRSTFINRRGKEKVQNELTLESTAFNLERILNREALEQRECGPSGILDPVKMKQQRERVKLFGCMARFKGYLAEQFSFDRELVPV